MPVERSGQEEFDFQYGARFGEHIESFDPTFVKVLVRYNPEGDVKVNRRQTERLAQLSGWLQGRGYKFLFELLVPATTAQLDSFEGHQDDYDRRLRPRLVVEAIASMQAAGVEPDFWKLEGLDSAVDAAAVVRQAQIGHRDHVLCIVLGRGANWDEVCHWLEVGAGPRVRRFRGGADAVARCSGRSPGGPVLRHPDGQSHRRPLLRAHQTVRCRQQRSYRDGAMTTASVRLMLADVDSAPL